MKSSRATARASDVTSSFSRAVMVIDPLLAILKIPSTPRESGTAEGWGDVGRRIGEVLPGDYMKFIELYGTGTIGDSSRRAVGIPYLPNTDQSHSRKKG